MFCLKIQILMKTIDSIELQASRLVDYSDDLPFLHNPLSSIFIQMIIKSSADLLSFVLLKFL
jgi:hypothetical protein